MVEELSYLDEIQAIEGMTPNTKYQTIIEHINIYMDKKTKNVDPQIWNETGQHLKPFYKLIIANKTQDYNMITELLQSEDTSITCKVLKCRWYFQGKNKEVINPKYFFQNIIPFVTMKTRREIVKSLGRNLRNTKMAEEFFIVFEQNYGARYSIPLLFACTDVFVKKKILEHRIIFSVNQVDRLYLRKPNVITYYFDLIKSRNNKQTSIISNETIQSYVKFLPKLIKRNHNFFYDIVKAWSLEGKFCHCLEKKYARNILKRENNGKSILEENPRIWIEFIRLEMINETMMNTIFPKLLPVYVNTFETSKAMGYLKYYPKDKVYQLISESYEAVYNQKFIDNLDNITIEFLPFVPVNLRNDILHLLKLNFCTNVIHYKFNYDSYLPTSANLEKIKSEINKAESVEDRVNLIIKMVYNCKVNDDSGALSQFLEYVSKRHKNERLQFWELFFKKFEKIYEFNEMKLKEWSGMDTLVINLWRNYMIHKIDGYSSIFQALILINYKNLSTLRLAVEYIDIYLEMVREHHISRWSRYNGKPRDENLFFVLMVEHVENKFLTVKSEWFGSSSNQSDSESNREHVSDLESNREHNSDLESNREHVSDLESNRERDSGLESNLEHDSDSSLNKKVHLWNDEVRIRVITDLVITMYELDEKYALYTRKKKIMKKKLLSSPFKRWQPNWLLSQVEDLLTKKIKISEESMKYLNKLKDSVKQREPELYEKLSGESLPKEFNFKVSAPFKMLKSDPKEVLNNATYFLETAAKSKSYHSGKIKRFFTMCRWYNKLPITFIEVASKRLSHTLEPYYLYLMAIILDGQSFTNIYEKLLLKHKITNFKEQEDLYYLDDSHFLLLESILMGIQTSNPPVSLETVANFYDEDFSYILNISEIIFNLCWKTSFNKVQHYLQTMSHKKVILKRNVIRIWGFAETTENYAEYLLSRWKEENEHPSIRVAIFKASNKLFVKNPKQYAWSTLKYCMETYKFNDWEHHRPDYFKTNVLPNEYINDVIKTTILMIMKVLEIELVDHDRILDKIQSMARKCLYDTLYNNLSDYHTTLVDETIILNLIEKCLLKRNLIEHYRLLDIIISNYLFVDVKQCLSKLTKLGKIMENTCEEWFKPVLKNDTDYPVRKEVGQFLERIKDVLLKKDKSNSICPFVSRRIIDETIRIFYKIPIYIDIWSYIMLKLAKYFIRAPDLFIEYISDKLIKICNQNKCTYIILAKAIDHFLFTIGCNNESFYYPLINRLLKNDKCSLSKMTAMYFLPIEPSEINKDEYVKILDKLREFNDPEMFNVFYAKVYKLLILENEFY